MLPSNEVIDHTEASQVVIATEDKCYFTAKVLYYGGFFEMIFNDIFKKQGTFFNAYHHILLSLYFEV